MWREVPSHSRVRVGHLAGSVKYIRKQPYRQIGIRGWVYSAHRLAFLYMRGYLPYDQMDHKDRNGLNNRWLNLRECTHAQNQANRRVGKNNKLGVKGVSRRPSGRYRAKIWVGNRRISLGNYNTLEMAAHAYRKAARKHFGEFASW